MKKCNKCKQEKNNEEFPVRNGKGLIPYCHECKKLYDREYWAKTKNKRSENKKVNSKSIRLRNTIFIYNFLLSHPCEICGENNPLKLTFDHLDPKLKENNIAEMKLHSLDKVQKEIEKCRVLCGSCHLEWTAKQSNSIMYKLYIST